jgi:hypothetical protein
MNLFGSKSRGVRAAGASVMVLAAGACSGKSSDDSHKQPLSRSVDAAAGSVEVQDAATGNIDAPSTQRPSTEGGTSLTAPMADVADAAHPTPTLPSQMLADGGNSAPSQPIVVDAAVAAEVPWADADVPTDDVQNDASSGFSALDAGDASAQQSEQDAGLSPTDSGPEDAAVPSSTDAGVCEPIITVETQIPPDGSTCYLRYGDPGSACHAQMDSVFASCYLLNEQGPGWSQRCSCDGATSGHINVWFSDLEPGFPFGAEACLLAAAECLALAP